MKRTFPLALLLAALMGTATSLMAADQVQQTVAQAPGIAAKYPGDRGIDKDPAVIFAEGFEQQQLPEAGYGKPGGFYDMNGYPELMHQTATDPAAGQHCLELIHKAGVVSPQWMHRTFPGQDTVYVRFYRKFDTDWVWAPLGIHDTIIHAGKYGSPAAADIALYLDISGVNQVWTRKKTLADVNFVNQPILVLKASFQGEGLFFGDDWLGANWMADKEVVSHVGWDNYYVLPFNMKPAPVLQGGRWYCFEYMAKMNSGPGVKDGEARLWIDGVLVTEEKNLILRDPAHMAIKWDHWMLGPRYGPRTRGSKDEGPARDQKNWIDALVIATSYVGPLAK